MNRFAALVMATLAPNVAQADWQEHNPGGDTGCALGDDFKFYVHEGAADNDKVVVNFLGGGACWDRETCQEGSRTYRDQPQTMTGTEKGIFDLDNPDNPFKDHTHVVIPYCTGDIHWGEADHDYGEGIVQHRGAINVKSVLSWMEESISAPESILVTGCSAGSYGSIYWSPHIARMYPEARLAQVGDAGAGITTESFRNLSFPKWRAELNAPHWIPDLNPETVNWSDLDISSIYTSIAQHYPQQRFGQFNRTLDWIQIVFYRRMGGSPLSWQSQMLDSMAEISEASSNFQSFIADGADHCISGTEDFYRTRSDGQRYHEWLAKHADFADDDAP